MIAISNAISIGLNRLGGGGPGPGPDPDAQAFFDRVAAAGGVLTEAETTAVNQLVLNMKDNGTWTAMKAIYPMVGSSAAACAQNLKSSSFTGTFSSGWTFASTGATPNGTSAFMDTTLTPSVSLSANNIHLSYYSRTNSAVANSTSIGSDIAPTSPLEYCRLTIRRTGDVAYNLIGNTTIGLSQYVVTDSRGLFIANAPNSSTRKFYQNNTQLTPTSQTALGTNGLSTRTIYLSANHTNIASEFDNKECAFASIGDGLTDTQASNFYTSVQIFNQTLNRQVGAQIVSDADAQAYINRVYTAGGTLTNTEANAVNQLVIDMKSANVWTAMKAVYPMVGSSAAACAQNLKSSSFTGTFTSGWTFASTGATPNGTSAYMDTGFIPNVNSSLNNAHLSYYSRTQLTGGSKIDIGSTGGSTSEYYLTYDGFGGTYIGMHGAFINLTTLTTTTKFFLGSRISSTQVKAYYAGSLWQTITQNSGSLNTRSVYVGAFNGATPYYSNRQCAFASIGDGLTDTQASNFYTSVQTFQTSLSRNV